MKGARPLPPIAGSVVQVTSKAIVPPAQLDRYDTAMHLVSPPIEEGERCHMCDAVGSQLALHICWCANCVTAMFAAKGLKVIGALPKTPTPHHALRHAFRWHALVANLLRHELELAMACPFSPPQVRR